MKVDLFDFDLPPGLIASRPTSPREAAKLLTVRDGQLADQQIADLPDLLEAGDILVFNDARVLPGQLTGKKTADQRKIELTLHKHLSSGVWRAFAKPARKLTVSDEIRFTEAVSATVLAKDGGEVDLDFHIKNNEMLDFLRETGEMPLPPYIRKLRPVDARDNADYQTVYSRTDGAVAAPTAGLHFTKDLLARLDRRGIKRAMLTLLVGAGTFLPVKVEDTEAHQMHSEFGEIDAETAALINRTRAAGGRVVAVGTTSLRLLESAAGPDGQLQAFTGETDIFITPGYRFKAVDQLLTNFHLPRSTLFMLVSAFSGLTEMRAAYDHATASGYRFYSYGDAGLLWRKDLKG